MIAQTWAFTPREITIPVGAKVEIHVTSPDLQHGFKITDTNVNMQIVPGQVSTMSYTFEEVGEFPYICHEYCGSGHAAMFGVVNVVPASEFELEADAAPDEAGAAPDEAGAAPDEAGAAQDEAGAEVEETDQ